MREQYQIWIARLFFILSLCFFCWAIAYAAGFGTTVLYGLNSRMGNVSPGIIEHRLEATNFSLSPVTLHNEKTCGCEEFDDNVVRLGPFQKVLIVLKYRIASEEHGSRVRTISLSEQRGTATWLRTGTLHFFVK